MSKVDSAAEASEGDASRSGIQVIARAAAILRALKDKPTGMSLGQIAEQVGLARSTVQRIVAALQTERLVIATGPTGGLRLGPELQALAGAARYNIVESCRLLLSELSQRTGETADLSVLRAGGMIFLDQVPGTHRLRAVSSVGEVFPLTTTANGRACLAMLDNDKAEKLIRQELSRRQRSESVADVMATIEQVRQSGLAYDLGEHTEGICAIGIAFRDWVGDIHAVSVPVPAARFEAQKQPVEAALRGLKPELARLVE
ncbi:IclR family transcriptional regulator [Devosia aquimaris]|uniref:IclR family transcriptional regulator n=1 Tax=Devosia aquimaris TaxID=2866214 RepID=UPI001CD0D2AA|nr:IclR family transcriptional regulator [Devosia sp. CJK-A8-3]